MGYWTAEFVRVCGPESLWTRRNWHFRPHAIAKVVVSSVHEMPSLVLTTTNETWFTGISYNVLGHFVHFVDIHDR